LESREKLRRVRAEDERLLNTQQTDCRDHREQSVPELGSDAYRGRVAESSPTDVPPCAVLHGKVECEPAEVWTETAA